MSIIRINHDKENPYALINKSALEDTLSWGAKGLWAYLISRPDSWNVSVSMLVKTFQKEGKNGGGRDAIYKLLNELIKSGYCIRIQQKTKKGQFDSYEYIVLEHKKLKETLPKRENTETEPCREFPDRENRHLNNNDINNIEEEEEKNSSKPKKEALKEEAFGRKLTEEEEDLLDKIAHHETFVHFPSHIILEAILKYGVAVVRESATEFLARNPKIKNGKIPGHIGSSVAIFESICKKFSKFKIKNNKK